MIKNYAQAYKYLCRFTDYERMTKFHYSQTTFSLKRMERLLNALGNPHHRLCAVHIAGTKGKGSTAIILSQILQTAGYKVGLFTSPHLIDIRERIQILEPVGVPPKRDKLRDLLSRSEIPHLCGTGSYPDELRQRRATSGNGQPISKKDFTHWMDVITNAVKSEILSPTFFEMITAMALLHFANQKVDLAIMETGLGGRLDATNVITPLVSVITRIDFDHMDKLGHTIAGITREKAGIIKCGVPVVSLRQSYLEADAVIKGACRTRNATLYIAERKVCCASVIGRHQHENIALALAAFKVLNIKLSKNIIGRALRKLRLPGRLEMVSRRPYMVIDSAHNPVSMRATANSVKGLKYSKLILILGLSRDKQIDEILDIIIPLADVVILTGTDNPRLLRPIEFIRHLKEYHLARPIFLEPDYRKALRLANRLAGQSDLVLVTGSFYLAGAILGQNHTFPNPYP